MFSSYLSEAKPIDDANDGSSRTERMLRMENRPRATLLSCSDCKMSFYCSDDHWKAISPVHTEQPCEDGHDNLTQCQLNREIRENVLFAETMAGAKGTNGLPFQFAPDRVKPVWASLEDSNWDRELADEIKQQLRLPFDSSVSPYVRAATDALSMPMTILWALEHLHDSNDWTKKETLVIHVRIFGFFLAK